MLTETKTKNYLYFAPFFVLGMAVIPIVVALFSGVSQNLYWDGDYAIFLIDMHNASNFTQSLGISSRFGWAHPGPLNYYLLTPFYLASGRGTQSLMLGTLALNLVCLFGTAVIIFRLANRVLAGVFLLVFVWFFVTALRSSALWDVLVPFSTILPWVLAVFVACAVAVASYRWLPLLILTLCFLTQAHVSLWLPCTFIGIASTTLALCNRRLARSDLPWLVLAAAIAFILWVPPLLEWRNIVLIFRHFTEPSADAHSVSKAFRALTVLMGESIAYSDSPAENKYLALGLGLMLSTLPAIIKAVKTKNHFIIALGVLCFGSVAIFGLSLTRFTGPIMPHSILFMATLGPIFLMLALSMVVQSTDFMTSLLIASALIVLVAYKWQPISSAIHAAKTPDVAIQHLSALLADELHRHGQPQAVFIDHAVWPAAVGAVAQAYRNGEIFYILMLRSRAKLLKFCIGGSRCVDE